MKEEIKIRIKAVLDKKFTGGILLTFIMLNLYNAWQFYWPDMMHPFIKLVMDNFVVAFCVFVNVSNPSLMKVALELIKILGNGATLEEKLEQIKIILKAVVHKYNRLWQEQPMGMREAEAAIKAKEIVVGKEGNASQ